MCLEAIWGYTIQTLNCVGYDHNWVRGYDYDDDYAPLLPKGTILHIIGYMDNSPTNKNVPDPRNWQGSGNRSVANMFIDLGNRVSLTDEQFLAEMEARREKLKLTRSSVMIGCPLCNLELPDKCRARRRRAAGGDAHAAATAGATLSTAGVEAMRPGLVAGGAVPGGWRVRVRRRAEPDLRQGPERVAGLRGLGGGPGGPKYFVFGYMNRNWEEELDVPVGPDNGFTVGDADQGQPTHFLPRRNRFVFRVPVPAGSPRRTSSSGR